jgi:hypothetical protein
VDMLSFDVLPLLFPTLYDIFILLAIHQGLDGSFYKFRTTIMGVLDMYSKCLIIKIRPMEHCSPLSVKIALFY